MALKVKRHRHRRKRVRTFALVLLAIIGPLTLASYVGPRAQSTVQDMAKALTISLEPTNPESYAGEHVTGPNMLISVSDDRTVLQEIGFGRTPIIQIHAEYSVPIVDSPRGPNPFSFELESSFGISAFRMLDLKHPSDNGDGTSSYGAGVWEYTHNEPKRIVIDPAVAILNTDDGALRAKIVFLFEFKIGAPVVSQGKTAGQWVQSWGLMWKPSSEGFHWAAVDTSDPNWASTSDSGPSLSEHPGGVQMQVCPSCDLTAAFGGANEIKEISRDTYATVSVWGRPQYLEVSTPWRPWAQIDSTFFPVLGTIASAILTLFVGSLFVSDRNSPARQGRRVRQK